MPEKGEPLRRQLSIVCSLGLVAVASFFAVAPSACGGGGKKQTVPPAHPAPVATTDPTPTPPRDDAARDEGSYEAESGAEEGLDDNRRDRATAAQRPISDEEIARIVDRGIGIASCDDYARKMFRCFRHPSYPEAARESTRQAFADVLGAWNFEGLSPQERNAAMKAADDACRQAIEAIRQAGETICPGVW